MNELNVPKLDFPRIVILGGGFAGLKLARRLNAELVQTVLIDIQNYHTFQPLLYQVATAGLEPDSIASPLRKILKNKKRTHIRMAEVLDIQLSNNLILTTIGSISYDYLVIATGAKTNFFGLNSIEKYAMPMKSLTESLDLRSNILQNFEKALQENDFVERDSLMNFVIVGGGPTGVELAGALAELKRHVLPEDYPDLDIRRMQIHIVEAGNVILPPMSSGASSNAMEYLRSLDINVWTNTMVLDYDGKEIKTNNRVFKSRNLIWAAGVKGNIPTGVDGDLISGGRILVDEFGFTRKYNNVMAIGDVALMKTKDFPAGLPMLGSVAQQQGYYLADVIHRKLKGKKYLPFKYSDKGTMATIGRNKAVVDIGKLHLGGFIAWMMWLFIHMMLLVDFRNRVIVFFNWVWNYINFDHSTRLIVRKYKGKSTES